MSSQTQGVPWSVRALLETQDDLRLEVRDLSGRSEGLVGCHLVVYTRSVAVVGDGRTVEDWCQVSVVYESLSQNDSSMSINGKGKWKNIILKTEVVVWSLITGL